MSQPRLLNEALASLRRNPGPVYTYVLVSMVAVALASGLNVFVTSLIDEDAPPAWIGLYSAALQVALSAIVAALQACVFADLGREIDTPLWKCDSYRFALQRFFVPWFILNLLAYILLAAVARAAQAEVPSAQVMVELLFMVLCVMTVPVGACIMFWGRLRWSELGAALMPLVTQFRFIFPVVFLGLVGNFLQIIFFSMDHEGIVRPILGAALSVIPLTAIELMQFAATWEICRIHRNEDSMSDSDPLDF